MKRDKRLPPRVPYTVNDEGKCVPDPHYVVNKNGKLTYTIGFSKIQRIGSTSLKSFLPSRMKSKAKTKRYIEHIRSQMGDSIMENIKYLAGVIDDPDAETVDKIRAAKEFVNIALQPEINKTTKDVNVSFKLPSDDRVAAARFVRNVALDAGTGSALDAGIGAVNAEGRAAGLPGERLPRPALGFVDPEGPGREPEVADETVDDGVQEQG